MSSSTSSGHNSQHLHPSPPAASSSSSRPAAESSRNALPFSFKLPFQPNPSSTSLASSTAEGRPIPVDDTTVEHRTSALREINNNYPSRHRYAKSTGAQSSTYSEPVIVRSYYSPLPSRPVPTTRGGIIFHGRTATGTKNAGSTSAVSRILPFASKVTSAGNGMISSMARARATKLLSVEAPADTRLPPVEAFTFKSFMANMEAQGNGTDISADLDRIAEICARSRYSLSNQYEVHYAPHGSGSSFLAASPRHQDAQGPTLQAVSSDDERNIRRHRKRRSVARRNSRAMGTLETIMSSSRSSDEDKSKKRSAAEIAEEIRGRAARKDSDDSSPTISPQSTSDEQPSPTDQLPPKHVPAKRSASLALIEGSRQHQTPGDPSSPRASAAGLVGEPALPQASTSQLEIRTATEEELNEEAPFQRTRHRRPSPRVVEVHITRGAVPVEEPRMANAGILSALSSWMPWKSSDTTDTQKPRAEGSLRELLKTSDLKGKGVERLD